MTQRTHPSVVVEDQGTGYSIDQGGRKANAYRVALRVGPEADLVDFHRLKRAAIRQLARLVARAGERYDAGTLTEREYDVHGRRVWELCWHRRPADSPRVHRVGDGRGHPARDSRHAGGGGAHAGGVGG